MRPAQSRPVQSVVSYRPIAARIASLIFYVGRQQRPVKDDVAPFSPLAFARYLRIRWSHHESLSGT